MNISKKQLKMLIHEGMKESWEEILKKHTAALASLRSK